MIQLYKAGTDLVRATLFLQKEGKAFPSLQPRAAPQKPEADKPHSTFVPLCRVFRYPFSWG